MQANFIDEKVKCCIFCTILVLLILTQILHVFLSGHLFGDYFITENHSLLLLL